MTDTFQPRSALNLQTEIIYKIVSRTAWESACKKTRFIGSADDMRDGFIHFSQAHQISGTLSKHFQGQQDLLLIAVSAGILGDTLAWEASRGGELFPHLYGPLPTALALWQKPLEYDENNVAKFDAAWLAC